MTRRLVMLFVGATLLAGALIVRPQPAHAGYAPYNGVNVGDASIVEGDSSERNVRFSVTLPEQLPQQVVLYWHLAAGDAIMGPKKLIQDADFSHKYQGTLKFTPKLVPGGNRLTPRHKYIGVAIFGDEWLEPNETFYVHVSVVSGPVACGKCVGVGTIIDDDPDPTECAGMFTRDVCPAANIRVTTTDASMIEGDSTSATIRVMVSLSRPPWNARIQVPYTLSPIGGAEPRTKTDPYGDYKPKTGTLTYFGHKVDQYINIVVYGDTWADPGEGILVTLGTPTGGGMVTRAEGTVTFVDDDTPPPNVAPTVDAGPPASGYAGDPIDLDGTVTDPDDTPTTHWTIDSPDCTFADDTAIDTTVTCTTPGTYLATLLADDGHNSPVADTTSVTVLTPPNTPPSVNAGPNASGTTNTDIALDGSVTDPNSGDVVTTAWTIDTPDCTFADAAAIDTTVTCTTSGTFTATLTADDGHNDPVANTTNVIVNDPPTADAGADVQGATNAAINLDATVDDPDDTPTTTWTIDSPDCTFADAAAVDTTVTCTTSGTFTATLTAGDGHNAPVADTTNVIVDDPPTVDAGADVQGATNAAINLDATVDDPDDTPTTTWTIDSPDCTFADAAAVDTTVTCTTAGTFTATLTADDGHNAPVADTTNVIVDDPPTVDAGADVQGATNAAINLDATVDDPDDTPTTTWTIDSPDCTFADAAAVDTTVTCTTAGTFTATLTADDGHNAPVADTVQVTVEDPP